jgi:hypothetical protein
MPKKRMPVPKRKSKTSEDQKIKEARKSGKELAKTVKGLFPDFAKEMKKGK